MSIETIIAIISALGVGGLLGAFLNRYFEQQKKTSDHDIKIFIESDKKFSEQRLLDIVNYHLFSGYSIKSDDLFSMTEWCHFFEKAGNRYLDKKLSKETFRLVQNLTELTDFIISNFYEIREQSPHNPFKYLKPNLNPDYADEPNPEDYEEYQGYVEKLKTLTKKVIEQYSNYRFAIKRQLKI